MFYKLSRLLLLTLICLNFRQPIAHSAPLTCNQLFSKTFTYFKQHGGFVTLRDGSIVEGSIANGGLQPHTLVDYKHPALAQVISEARSLRHLDTLEKIKLLTALAHKTLINKEYSNPIYLEVMDQALRSDPQQRLSFGEYIRNKAGTCREHALFMHLVLLEAGVPNQLTYSKYKHFNYDRRNNSFTDVTEDHAFVVVDWRGQKYIVDSYFHEAHGQSVEQVMNYPTININSPRAPWAYDLWSQVPDNVDQLSIHVEQIHNFPTYYIPQN